jgi:hypothetical protein
MARARASPHNARLGACARLAAPRGAPEDVRSVGLGLGALRPWSCVSGNGRAESSRRRVVAVTAAGTGWIPASAWSGSFQDADGGDARRNGGVRDAREGNGSMDQPADSFQRAQIYLVPLRCLPHAARLTSASP